MERHAPSPPSNVNRAPGAYAVASWPRERVIFAADFSRGSVLSRGVLLVAMSISQIRAFDHTATNELHHPSCDCIGNPMSASVVTVTKGDDSRFVDIS